MFGAATQVFVLANGRIRRGCAEHAQALLGPIEALLVGAAAERIHRQPQRVREQRVAIAAERLRQRRVGRVYALLARPARHRGRQHHGVLLHLFGARLGFADAGDGHRVGLQEIRRAVATLVGAHRHRHALEEAGHRIHVVAAARQRADAQPVGFGFVGAGVVDLALLHQPHRAGDGGHGGVALGVAAGLLRCHHRRQHAEQDRNLVTFRTLHSTQHVLLGDVGDFVRQHRRHFVLALSGQHQPGIDGDVAAQRGECIDLAVAQHEESKRLLRLVAVGAQPGAHGLQPIGNQRVVQHVVVVAQLGQHHPAVFGLASGGQQLAGRRTDVGKAAFLRRCHTDGNGQRERSGER